MCPYLISRLRKWDSKFLISHYFDVHIFIRSMRAMHINAISNSFMCPFSTTSEVKLNITRSMNYANISCSASNQVTKKEQLDSSVVTSTLDVSCKYQQSHKSLNHGESTVPPCR